MNNASGVDMSFKIDVEHEVTPEEASAAADEIERAIGEIAIGKRKPGSIPLQELCFLLRFVRDAAKRTPPRNVR